ncbi:60S ribosomal protein L18a protein [Salix suchowensis]|nr:60S ribosomal protein L18a protein [Salix suchowensis]
MSDEEKKRGVVVDHHHHEDHPPPPPQPQYGTFQGVANYPPPPQHPAIGFPQPVPPPGATAEPYAHGYQTVPGYADAEVEGRPVTHRRLPCCGCGVGWFLFIIGFFLGAIPWYVGLFILACSRIDPREKPGYLACTIADRRANTVGTKMCLVGEMKTKTKINFT